MVNLTPQQKEALNALENAFEQCKKNGITFCGMDGCLFYATEDQIGELPKPSDYGLHNSGNYPVVARCEELPGDGSGEVDTHETYQDSGGW